MYDCVKQLHEGELWSNLAHVGPMVLARCRVPPNSGDQAPPFTPKMKRDMMVFVADAFLETKEYGRAEAIYKEALQLRKNQRCKKTSAMSETEIKAVSDVEVKYKLHLCYTRTGQQNLAIEVLQSVPAKQRTPKINQALGRIYQMAGMERPAVTCYREVVKACPLALEATETLMVLGVKPKEVHSLTLDVTSNPPAGLEWLNQWIQGLTAFASRDYVTAASKLKQLEDSLLRNNITLLTTLGLSQHYNGDHSMALSTLQRVHRLEPTNLKGMDVLACLMAKERKIKDLEALATKLMLVTEEAPEPWIAMGYYCFATKRETRAAYFAHRSCMLQHRYVEGLLLKGDVLLELKKLQDSMHHFREAELVAPHRYEVHRGLAYCYLAQSRHREAVCVASNACKSLNNSARSLTLLATVLMKDPLQLSTGQARSLLEKALSADANYIPAVFLLAKIYEQERNLGAAIELLRKQVSVNPSCRLHLMLADLLGKTQEEEKAMEHYSTVLSLNPRNTQAQEGLQRLEQATDTILERTFDIVIEENSDDGDHEESETEAVWSDADLTNLAASF